jgi:hypothetical protein
VAKPTDHQLAAGAAIEARTLTVTQTTVAWVQDGRHRSARI